MGYPGYTKVSPHCSCKMLAMSESVPEIVIEAADPAPPPESKPAIPTVSPETAKFLEPYLPPSSPDTTSTTTTAVKISIPLEPAIEVPFPSIKAPPTSMRTRPFVTLTYATSLDSHLALSPGVQTHLSGPLSKSLTHYLRSKHDGILVGVGTATADDPGLNCRTEGVGGFKTKEEEEKVNDLANSSPLKVLDDDDDDDDETEDPLAGQPRPIILDPNRRWHFTRDSRVFQTVREGKGRAPIILTRASARQGTGEAERWRILCEHGGMFMCPKEESKDKSKKMKAGGRWSWNYILEFLYKEAGIKSLMIEGGAEVINDLLGKKENMGLIDSVVVTIAPVYLGKGGVNVSPDGKKVAGKKVEAANFKDVEWTVLGRDVVMAARPLIE